MATEIEHELTDLGEDDAEVPEVPEVAVASEERSSKRSKGVENGSKSDLG